MAGGLFMVVAFARSSANGDVSDLEYLVGAAGAVAALGGTALLAGPLLALIARAAGRLRSVTRLAVRDSNRQRARAATAVAAIMVAVAIPTAAAAGLASTQDSGGDGIDPRYVIISSQAPDADAITAVASETLISAVSSVIDVRAAAPVEAAPFRYTYDIGGADVPGGAAHDGVATEYVCISLVRARNCSARAGIATAGVIQALDFGPDAQVVLAEGGIVSTRPLPVGYQFRDGEEPVVPTNLDIAVANQGSSVILRRVATVRLIVDRRDAEGTVGGQIPDLWISPETHRSTGVPTPGVSAVIVVASHPLSNSDRKAVWDVIWKSNGSTLNLATGPYTGTQWSLYATMHSPRSGLSRSETMLIVVGIASVIAALIAVVVAALSAVELDRDLGVMVAAGAPPSLRRRFLGIQSTYHVALAAVLGIPIGLLLEWAVTNDGTVTRSTASGTVFNDPTPFNWPWTAMVLLGIALPLLVGTVIAATFRSGRPIQTRRST